MTTKTALTAKTNMLVAKKNVHATTKTVLAIVIYSFEKQLTGTLAYPFSALARNSGVEVSFACSEKTDGELIKDEVLFDSILGSAITLFEKKDNFSLAVIADGSVSNLHEKLIRLNAEATRNGDTLLVSMVLYDGRTPGSSTSERKVLERSIDSFYDTLNRNSIQWIRVHNSVIVYQDSMPIVHKMYSCSYRYCMRVVTDDYTPLAFDVFNQFTNFFQLFYSNPRVLRSFGKRKSIAAAVEIDRFLSATVENWDFYSFTGSVVSSIIDTFEKLKSRSSNGYCLTGPNEHSLACGAVANWQLYGRSYVIVITSGMGDELKGTLVNLKQSRARGFIIVAEANPGTWFPFQGSNHADDNIKNVMKARDLPVVSFTDPENTRENLAKAFHLYHTSNGPVVLLLSTKVLMSTEEVTQPIPIPASDETLQQDEKHLHDIVTMLNQEPSRIIWRCGSLSELENQLVQEIADQAGIVLVDGITRPGSVATYQSQTLLKNYFGSFSLYGYSKKIYRYLTENGKIRDKKKQVLFFLKSKISQISSPFSEASLRNKFRIVQVNNNPSHIAPFADYYCQMNLIDFLKQVKGKLNVVPEVLAFRKNTIENTTTGKDTYSKSTSIRPMFPNYFFTQLNQSIEQLITDRNYTYTGIYDVGRNGVSAFRNIARTGPGFSGWYGRALMGDALLAINSLAATAKDNVLAFIGDGAKKMVPDIRANMIDNILHQRKKLDINISIFYLVNGFFSLINTFQESFLFNRSRRQMSCLDFLEPDDSFEIDGLRINQQLIEKYDHQMFETALSQKGTINFFYVLLSHNNTGDGLSLASIKSYSWQEE